MTTEIKSLPANPNLTQLKKQAKDLKKAVEANDPQALARVAAFHPSYDDVEAVGAQFSNRDAQLTIAREYGFDGWHQLNTEVGNRMVDERDLHRWFGVQLNNGMWDKLEDESFGPTSPAADRELMLYSAYASAYHWRNAGNEVNYARGEHLISRMAAKIGEGEIALRHARRCLELVKTRRDVMEDWDEPFAREALARALSATGSQDEARENLDLAIAQTATVADPGDREVLEAELERGPWFGLR